MSCKQEIYESPEVFELSSFCPCATCVTKMRAWNDNVVRVYANK